MLKLRSQLPAYSPIRLASLGAGAAGALGLGRPRERLRAHLADHYGTHDIRLTDSGTSALRLAIEGALETASADGTEAGDVVLLPAYGCYDVATAAVGAGARVRLYDLDPRTLGPDWDSLDEAIRAGAAAVVAVHLYGIPVDMERLSRLSAAGGALVIEDAAQGFGGSIGRRPLGSVGSLGVLSFGRGKGITGGGGGALLANDEAGGRALARVLDRPTRGAHGWAELARLAAQWLLGRPAVYGLPASLPWLGLGETRYREPWRPRDVARGAAAAVLANWRASVAEADVRRANAAELADLGIGRAVEASSTKACPLRLPVCGSGACGIGSAARSTREGVVPGYPDTLAALLPGTGAARSSDPYPGARFLAAHLLTAPTHSRTRPARVRRVLAGTDRRS